MLAEMLQEQPMVLLAVAAILGLVTGSFLNVVIYRLPLMLERSWRSECRSFLGLIDEEDDHKTLNLVLPNSFCPNCGDPIRPWHNIPVLSYVWLRGRCSRCSARIPLRYPLIEILTAVVTAVVAWKFGWSWQTAAGWILSWMLIVLSLIDLERQLLPDVITLPGVWLGLLTSLGGVFTDPGASIVGACLGYCILWLVYHLFRLTTGKQGMGHGDFKLLAMLGAWLGWEMLPAIVLLSSTAGALLGIWMIAFMGRAREKPIPFGPYLALAGWIALLWGPELNAAYLGWLARAI